MKRIFSLLLIFVSILFLASCDRIEEPGATITPIFTKILLTGDTDVVYEDSIKGNYLPGHTVELKTHVLMDADIEVYLDGERIPKTHDDSDYWGYKFIIPSSNENFSVTLDIKVVDGFKIVYPIIEYYQHINVINPTFINEPDFLTSLEMEERYVYPFSNYDEFVTFSNKHFGYVVKLFEDLDLNSFNDFDMFYKLVLVARRSNYNGSYKYYDYSFIQKTIKEDIYFATFEEVVIFDFVLVDYKTYVTFNE